MRTLEKISLTIVSLVIIAKIFRVPFSGPIIVFVLSLVGMIYFILGWKIFETPESKKNQVTSTIIGFIYLIISIGVLFKLQLWPNGQSIIVQGSFLGLCLLTFLLIKYLLNKKTGIDTNYFLNLLKRSVGIVGICLALALIPIKALVTFYHPDDEKYVRLYMRAYEAENNQEYWNEFSSYRDSKK